MIKRNHPLTFAEKVYDSNTGYIYHITAIYPNGTIGLGMTDADIRENLLMFDCEITEDEYEYTTDAPDMLYQFVPNLVGRDGNNICYEHNTLGLYEEEGGDYPYYSPYLDENLFSHETFTREEYGA